MNILDSILQSNDKVTAAFQQLDQTMTNGILGAKSYSAIQQDSADLVVTGLMWQASASDRIISEKMSVDIDMMLVVKSTDITVSIPENSRVVIDSIPYSIVTSNEIAFQDEITVYSLTRII